MTRFLEACGVAGAGRDAAVAALLARVRELGLEQVRIGWCDAHGVVRGKSLLPRALPRALGEGVSMVSTVLLKDTSDRTAYRVFDGGVGAALPGFGVANNLLLVPDPASFVVLPWSGGRVGWLRAEAHFDDGTPVEIDSRVLLRRALATLREAGYAMRVGLEVEFHVYRLLDGGRDASLDPARAEWPGEPPAVALVHPGYNLLAEGWADRAHEPLDIVRATAEGLGLPIASIEVELGPSQVEAVFDAVDALDAADAMVAFRDGVRQALHRAGYLASFVCRPPFPNAMASGWHLHHSLVDSAGGANAFRAAPGERMATGVWPGDVAVGGAGDAATDAGALAARSPNGVADADAASVLSPLGAHWLAGLLAHGRGLAAICAPTINAYSRFRPGAMAPAALVWGRDNRGAMLRVVGRPGDAATRIENRIGEPAANPYLTMAAHVHAGLDGIARGLQPPPATTSPYADAHERLPASLDAALDALEGDAALVDGFGRRVVDWFCTLKRSELARHAAADDRDAWQRREYFGRF